MKRIDITTSGWDQYQLIDSGEGRKLERFADILIDRPDPQCLWSKSLPAVWADAQAQFLWADAGERWKISQGTPPHWYIQWQKLVCTLSFKGFKHIGIFPEHREQWEELMVLGEKNRGIRMLNLFGYTGALSVAGAIAGMSVTHVDASKATIETLKENTINSGLEADAIKIICEDTMRYVKRLINRNEQFEVIVMDPPAFGRGPKGEVWKIEESLTELVSLLPKLLSPNAKSVILNGYASGYSARTFGEILRQGLSGGDVSYGDIGILQGGSEKVLTTGIYAKWQQK